MTLIASFRSGSQSLSFIMITALRHLKNRLRNIADKDFSTEIDAKGPIEFQSWVGRNGDMSA